MNVIYLDMRTSDVKNRSTKPNMRSIVFYFLSDEVSQNKNDDLVISVTNTTPAFSPQDICSPEAPGTDDL